MDLLLDLLADLDPVRLLDLEPVLLRDLLLLPDLLDAAERDLLRDLDMLLLPLLLLLLLLLLLPLLLLDLSPADGLLDLLFSLDTDLDLSWSTACVSASPSSLDWAVSSW